MKYFGIGSFLYYISVPNTRNIRPYFGQACPPARRPLLGNYWCFQWNYYMHTLKATRSHPQSPVFTARAKHPRAQSPNNAAVSHTALTSRCSARSNTNSVPWAHRTLRGPTFPSGGSAARQRLATTRPCPPARSYLSGGGSWRLRGAAGGVPRAGGCGSFLFGRHWGNAERRLGAAAGGRRRGEAAAPSGSESSDSLRPKRRWKRPRRAMPSSAPRRREERGCAGMPARRRPEPGRHRGQRCAGGGLSAGMDGARRWLPPAAVYALLRRSPPAVPAHRRPPRSLPAEGAAPRQVPLRWHRKGAAGVRSVPRVRIRGHYLVVALRRPSGPSRALAPLAGKGSAVGARHTRSPDPPPPDPAEGAPRDPGLSWPCSAALCTSARRVS